jgi:ribonuclease P protein component
MVNFSSKHLTLKTIEGPNKGPVIIVSKKVAPLAVLRNRIKRRLRKLCTSELIDTNKVVSPLVPVIYTRKGVGELSFSELELEIKEIGGKIH